MIHNSGTGAKHEARHAGRGNECTATRKGEKNPLVEVSVKSKEKNS